MMKSFFKNTIAMYAIAFLFTISHVNSTLAQEINAGNAKEKKILLLVAALPEVQKRAQYIKRLSKGKTQITLMVSAQPDFYIPYYQVNVNDNAPTYENYYQFAVDPKTYQIFFYDPAANKQYTLTEWRKRTGKKAAAIK